MCRLDGIRHFFFFWRITGECVCVCWAICFLLVSSSRGVRELSLNCGGKGKLFFFSFR